MASDASRQDAARAKAVRLSRPLVGDSATVFVDLLFPALGVQPRATPFTGVTARTVAVAHIRSPVRPQSKGLTEFSGKGR